MDRRRVLEGGLALAAAGLLPGACTRAPRSARAVADRTLVLIELSGGNDGLSTLVPFGDDRYHALRPTSRIASAEVLKVDDSIGWHPKLRFIAELFDQGRVAVLEGVGYPEPQLSHFRSLETWHTAFLDQRDKKDGWIGRLRDSAWGADPRSELVVHVGERAPLSVLSTRNPALLFANPEMLQAFTQAAPGDSATMSTATSDLDARRRTMRSERLAHIRRSIRLADEGSRKVLDALRQSQPRGDYPPFPLSPMLRSIAALLQSDLSTRVFTTSYSGFDHHSGPMRYKNDHLLEVLDDTLRAFFRDLQGTSAQGRTLVVLYSEFGRRLAENGGGGLDHGAAGPVVLIGDTVSPGLHGTRPPLSELDEFGNLVHTVDFRTLYQTLIVDWFGADPLPVLGRDFGRRELLRV